MTESNINLVILTFVTTDKDGTPSSQAIKYEITDDGCDIIDYIEDRKTTISKEYWCQNKIYIKNKKSDSLEIGDEVQVQKSDHPLDGWTGKIKQIYDDDRVCLVLIDGYVFNIKKAYLEKYEP